MSNVDEHEERGFFEVKIPGWYDGEQDKVGSLEILACRPGTEETALNLMIVDSPYNQIEFTPERWLEVIAAMQAAYDYYTKGQPE